MLLITGSCAPSSLWRAISKACETVVDEDEKVWELAALCDGPFAPIFADEIKERAAVGDGRGLGGGCWTEGGWRDRRKENSVERGGRQSAAPSRSGQAGYMSVYIDKIRWGATTT